MRMTRRDLAIAGVLAIGAANLLRGSAALAQATDEGAVKDNVDALRKALLSQDKAELDKLTANQLSYGHSDGRFKTKPNSLTAL
jgi:hypothetical protein